MDYEAGFILQKDVNWSLLNEGLAIPVSVCSRFAEWDASILKHGASKMVKILIGDEFYEAKLINQNFDQRRFQGHKDIIQIRYSPNSLIAAKLRSVFQESYSYFFAQRQLKENYHRQLLLPSDIHEYIRLYITPNADVLCMECCTNVEYQQVASRLSVVPEEIYEISGEKIGEEYGNSVVEAHHIDYFTKSQNNDSTNIIIISPNYHRIIHKNNPNFNRKKFQFEFNNGEVLKLKLFEHLRAG